MLYKQKKMKQRSTRFFIFGFAFLMLLSLNARVARADSFGVNAYGYVGAFGDTAVIKEEGSFNEPFENKLFDSVSLGPVSTTYHDDSGDGTASAALDAAARLGHIEMSGLVASTYSGFYTGPGAEMRGGGFWLDTLKITSDTLPEGAPVELLATFIFRSDISGEDIYSQSSVAAQFQLAEPGRRSLIFQLTDSVGEPLDGGIRRGVFSTTVGSTISFSTYLEGVGYSYSGSSNDFSINKPTSADSYIKVLTPGASYTSASGTSYTSATAVPEPASVVLLLSGLLGVGGGASRRRRRANKN